jgi:hypothetical protein
MAGMSVPVVMFPRFTTLCGEIQFETMAMDISRYSGAELTAWRGAMAGGASSWFKITCQESTDGTDGSWTDCDGGTQAEVLQNVQEQFSLTFTKRLFRVLVNMDGDGSVPVATCWMSGFFEQRVS